MLSLALARACNHLLHVKCKLQTPIGHAVQTGVTMPGMQTSTRDPCLAADAISSKAACGLAFQPAAANAHHSLPDAMHAAEHPP